MSYVPNIIDSSHCRCFCHRSIGSPSEGVRKDDPVGALTACSQCRSQHVAAFRAPPEPKPVDQGEGPE